MIKDAVLSPDGQYRYLLTRNWEAGKPNVTFIMLNPSTADANVDDPTIRRCIAFAQREGGGSLSVVNLFAYRSTDVQGIRRVSYPVGPENDEYIRQYSAGNLKTVLAWGKNGNHMNRAGQVLKILADFSNLWTLGLNNDGSPKHPLYVRKDQILLPYKAEATT